MSSSRKLRRTPTVERGYGQEESLGVSSEKARIDHTHGTPDDILAEHEDTTSHGLGYLLLEAQDIDPSISAGQAAIWLASGAGTGDAGDVLIKVSSGGEKISMVHDHSKATA